MQAVETREWVFTTAQTDLLLLDDAGASLVGAAQQMVPTYVQAVCANSNSVDVHVRLGFGATTLPAMTNNSANGQPGVFFTHPAIARGGGAVAANGGASLVVGPVGLGPRLTCGAATGGSWRLVLSFALVDAEVTS
jgi:hypothetical protein